MKIRIICDRTDSLVTDLCAIWRRSVGATHGFLDEGQIYSIAQYVPAAIRSVPTLVIIDSDDGDHIGFMGVSDDVLEMLFIDEAYRGMGAGSQLIQFGVEELGVTRLTVNEQNPQALGFYEHKGFTVYDRSDLDEQGMPFPLLYMKLSKKV